MSAPTDVEAVLEGVLKRYDRIGFGRRGVLDAEQELLRLAAGLCPSDHARFRLIVLSWIEASGAERAAAALHYNLPEHVRALAIRLCASVPIPESVPLLQRLRAEDAFPTEDARPCREALNDALARLSAPEKTVHSGSRAR